MKRRLWLRMVVLACLSAAVTGCGKRAVVDAVDAGGLAVEKPGPHTGSGPAPGGGEPFAFPRDPGGVLLSKLLPPENTTSGPGDRRTQPTTRPTPRFMELQSGPAAVPPAPGLVPALPQKPYGIGLRPRVVTEEFSPDPAEAVGLPRPIVLATTERTRVDSPNPNEHLQLPILAQAVVDRVSLDDATIDASTSLVLAARMPQRSVMVPFLRVAIPDPFEYRRPLTLSLPPEPTEPLSGSPQLPQK
jgi:hypothetical protein